MVKGQGNPAPTISIIFIMNVKIIGIGGNRIYGDRMIFSGVGWLKDMKTLPLQFQLFLL
jgi:hypothetical protein